MSANPPPITGYPGMKDLWLPRTVMEADSPVSMPKIKATSVQASISDVRHCAGATYGGRTSFTGLAIGHLLNSSSSGPALLSGGAAGPEGSLLH